MLPISCHVAGKRKAHFQMSPTKLCSKPSRDHLFANRKLVARAMPYCLQHMFVCWHLLCESFACQFKQCMQSRDSHTRFPARVVKEENRRCVFLYKRPIAYLISVPLWSLSVKISWELIERVGECAKLNLQFVITFIEAHRS